MLSWNTLFFIQRFSLSVIQKEKCNNGNKAYFVVIADDKDILLNV